MRRKSLKARWAAGRLCRLALAGTLLALPACKVVTAQQLASIRAHGAGSFDVDRYIENNWPSRALPALERAAVPLSTVTDAAKRSPAQLDRFGRRAGEGSPVTVVIGGNGTVQAIDRVDPKGHVTLDADGTLVTLQTGPVVSGTAVRDALPFVSFDDVPDQITFAELGTGLTERALAPLRPTLARLKAGDRVRFIGATAWGARNSLIVTPISLAVEP